MNKKVYELESSTLVAAAESEEKLAEVFAQVLATKPEAVFIFTAEKATGDARGYLVGPLGTLLELTRFVKQAAEEMGADMASKLNLEQMYGGTDEKH